MNDSPSRSLEAFMTRPLSILTKLTLALAIGECLSAVALAVEDYAGSVPAFAVVFAALFVGGAWLLHRRRVVAGASLVGFLSLFELLSFPGWQKHNVFDWIFDGVYIALAAATLAVAVGVLVTRHWSRPVGA